MSNPAAFWWFAQNGIRASGKDDMLRAAQPSLTLERLTPMYAIRLAVAAVGLIIAGATHADDEKPGCAPNLRGKPLLEATIFDGPPSDNASLAPLKSSAQQNIWSDLKGGDFPKFLVCSYGAKQTVQTQLPASVSKCTGTFANGSKSYTAFSCW